MTAADPVPITAWRSARVLQVRVGRPAPLPLLGAERTVDSAIDKTPVTGAVDVTVTGLAGDQQADLRRHGGPDKAVCVYPVRHYTYWRQVLRRPLSPGAFGENLVVDDLDERSVCAGDVLRAGSAVVEVSMPRRPCFKLAARHGIRDLAVLVQRSGRTGFYLRTLQPGRLAAGDPMVLLERPAGAETVHEVNRVMNLDRDDHEAARRLIRAPALPDRWRRDLQARLEGRLRDDRPRLLGPHGSRPGRRG